MSSTIVEIAGKRLSRCQNYFEVPSSCRRLKVQLGEWRWILGQCLGEAAAAGRNSVGGTKEHSTVLRVQSD